MNDTTAKPQPPEERGELLITIYGGIGSGKTAIASFLEMMLSLHGNIVQNKDECTETEIGYINPHRVIVAMGKDRRRIAIETVTTMKEPVIQQPGVGSSFPGSSFPAWMSKPLVEPNSLPTETGRVRRAQPTATEKLGPALQDKFDAEFGPGVAKVVGVPPKPKHPDDMTAEELEQEILAASGRRQRILQELDRALVAHRERYQILLADHYGGQDAQSQAAEFAKFDESLSEQRRQMEALLTSIGLG